MVSPLVELAFESHQCASNMIFFNPTISELEFVKIWNGLIQQETSENFWAQTVEGWKVGKVSE